MRNIEVVEIGEVLLSLGVNDDTLSDGDKLFLDENGYLPLAEVLTSNEVEALAKRLDELAEAEGGNAGKEVDQEKGTQRLSNLVDKDPIFEQNVTHPRVLAAIDHVLESDFKLSSLNSRAVLPGQGHQRLHADWDEAVRPGDYKVCNSIWLLDDFTTENGATRLVPGSHRLGKLPSEVMDDPESDHPDQILTVAKAGTVVVFNSHTWHGGTFNRTNALRRAMYTYYCRRGLPQQTNQREYLRKETIARLSPQAQIILDVEDA